MTEAQRRNIASFEVRGKFPATGKTRKMTLRALTIEHAIAMACLEGLTDVTATQLPEPKPAPATERQRAYAKSLGIKLKASATVAEASAAITAVVGEDSDHVHDNPITGDASRAESRLAQHLGFTVAGPLPRWFLYEKMNGVLANQGDSSALVLWFVARVLDDLHPELAESIAPDDQRLAAVAASASQDVATVRSIRGYQAHGFARFRSRASGATRSTVGYAVCAKGLREAFGLPANDPHRRQEPPSQSRSGSSAPAGGAPAAVRDSRRTVLIVLTVLLALILLGIVSGIR